MIYFIIDVEEGGGVFRLDANSVLSKNRLD